IPNKLKNSIIQYSHNDRILNNRSSSIPTNRHDDIPIIFEKYCGVNVINADKINIDDAAIVAEDVNNHETNSSEPDQFTIIDLPAEAVVVADADKHSADAEDVNSVYSEFDQFISYDNEHHSCF